jgi:uncharacterized membrane-anchored protein YjiN (DUF445 family)
LACRAKNWQDDWSLLETEHEIALSGIALKLPGETLKKKEAIMKAVREINEYKDDLKTSSLFNASFTYPKYEHIDEITRNVGLIMDFIIQENEAKAKEESKQVSRDYVNSLYLAHENETKIWDFGNYRGGL